MKGKKWWKVGVVGVELQSSGYWVTDMSRWSGETLEQLKYWREGMNNHILILFPDGTWKWFNVNDESSKP